MTKRRARCPFCPELTSNLPAHIEAVHFPRHCTVCKRIQEVHPKTDSSPPVIYPCEGGKFVTRIENA